MRIAVIYNEPEPTPPEQHWLWRSPGGTQPPSAGFRDESEFGVLGEIDFIVDALAAAGHEPKAFSAASAAELCRFLGDEGPDLIFNCCEAFRGNSALEMNVAAVFELFGVPYTGSSAATLGAAVNKGVAKALFTAHGIPTPRYAVVELADDLNAATTLAFPLIVKPLREDASIGIDVHAVVGDTAALARRVRFVLEEFRQPALVEEFIDGRELNVAVLATGPDQFVTLPISEILFQGLPEGAPRIVGYEAKWVKESPYYSGTRVRCPAETESAVAAGARALALQAVRALGVRDYGRVDLRQRRDGKLFVIEVNPNPDLNDEAGFLSAARASGRTRASTICEIAQRAIERCGREHAVARTRK